MKVRLIGMPEEVTAAAGQIGAVLDVIEISPAYPCRGASRQVRLYLETRPSTRLTSLPLEGNAS